MRSLLILFLMTAPLAGPGLAGGPDRWVPEHCLEYRQGAGSWNAAYSRGFRSIAEGDYHAAEAEMCRAALAAREFDARDWRFAETLDELGLIAFELRDLELAERMQGAAIAEMLLAVGPYGEPLREHDPSNQSPIRDDCRSGLGVYVTRLGWILERAPGRTTTAAVREAPWRIFQVGYLPLDSRLAGRLEWLISRYLLEENLAAAEALAELQRRIRAE